MVAVVNTVPCRKRRLLRRRKRAVETTLLELVVAIAGSARDDREIVATVLHLLRSGRVRLIGSFRGQRVDTA